MNKKIVSILAFGFLLVVNTVSKLYAQIHADSVKLPFEYIGSKEGLSQGYVPAMLQDREGFMWFATKDGLNKYDGYHMQVFRNHSNSEHETYGLTDNDIAYIEQDTMSFIWVATASQGLFVFDKRYDKFHPVRVEHTGTPTFGYLHNEGAFLFANTSSDWFVYNLATVREQLNTGKDSIYLPLVISYKQQALANTLPLDHGWFALGMMPDYSIWMARKDSLFVFEYRGKKQWQSTFLPVEKIGMKDESIFHFFSIERGAQYVFFSPNRITIYNRIKQQISYQLDFKEEKISKDIFMYNYPAKIGEDQILFPGKHAWYLLNTTTKRCWSLSGGAGDFSGKSRVLSNDGYLWVGSAGRGVYKYNLRAAHFHTDHPDCNGFETNASDEVYVKFRDGTTRYDYVNRKRSSSIPKELYTVGIKEAWLWSSDPQGQLWYGAHSSTKKRKNGKEPLVLLIRYNPVTKTCVCYDSLFRYDIYFRPNGYPAFFIDSKNQCWQRVHTADGSVLFYVTSLAESDKTTMYEFPKKYIHQYGVFHFQTQLEDSNGNLWFATNAGLFCFHPQQKNWTVVRHNERIASSVSANQITSLLLDKNNKNLLWVGTAGNGFNAMDLRNFSCERFTEQQGLSNNVINAMLQDDSDGIWISTNQGISCINTHTKRFTNYSQDDGLAGNEFNTGQSVLLKNGMMFFGGVDGITFFNPAEVYAVDQHKAKVVFTKAVLINETIDCIHHPNIINQAIGFAHEMKVPYDKNILRFEFSLLQFAPSEKKKYRYYLEGYTKTWINNGSSNSIAFTNLDPGNYVLHVQGCSSHGTWSEQEAVLRITILTPWFKSWWFYALVVLSVGGLLYSWYRYRLNQSLKMVMMRNVIASDLHDEIGSTISSISLYSDIIENKIQEDNVKEIAQRIGVSSREILIAMSDIVWSINPKNDRFDNVVIRMKSFVNDVLEAQNKQVDFNIDPALMQINLPMDQRKNFYLIFKEAIHNAMKYAQANTVRITIKAIDRELWMCIEDDGIGFDTSDVSEGNGLHNMQQRANDLKGNLLIQSSMGKGTRIELRFPFK